MAATKTSAVRYAPEDPSLPKPWKGLIDGKTGYLYFWNPETNVTQYRKPSASETCAKPSASETGATPGASETGATPGPSETGATPGASEIGATPGASETGTNPSALETGANPSASETGANPSASETGASRQDETRSVSISSSVQAQQYTQAPIQDNSAIAVDGGNDGNNGGSKLDSGQRSYLGSREESETSNISHGSGGAIKGDSAGRGLSAVGSSPAESYRKKHEITVSGNNVPLPFTSFQAAGIPPEMLKEVVQAGFSAPTPIQAQSWPIAFQGRDIVAIAKTGSGKTLGYMIPAFRHLKLCRKNSKLGPIALVLSPTRELATQIQDEAVKFGSSSRISCTCLYGGAPKGPQLRDLDKGTDIVVATPGRLNDILQMKRVNLGQISYLVLDEADRMLDMGFEPQIRKIVNEIPTRRQTLMYTATWPKEVRKIAADLLHNPVQVNIGNVDELVANKSITQHVEIVSSMEKQRRVEQIVRSQEPGSKIIIFCSTKKMCDQLSRNLSRQYGATAIHGDKNQSERDHVLSQFRTGKSPILVATDVAARGLDVKDIKVVINYDFPSGVEDYVHRIGRTGRAGSTGVAHTFFGDQDAKHASDLVKILEGANQRVPDEIREMASRGGFGRPRGQWGSGSGGRYDSGYGGRGGGNGHGSESESRDSDGYGRSGSDVHAPGSYHAKSFHESMIQGPDKQQNHGTSPEKVSNDSDDIPASFHGKSFHDSMISRGRSKSPNKGGDHFERSRSRSRSPDRFDSSAKTCEQPPARSFHEAMMEQT